MWWLVIPAVIAMFVGCLALADVLGWFEDNASINSSHGELIKTRLKNGNYKVIAGVFNKRGTRTATHSWEADELDSDIQSAFGRKSRIRVEV